MKLIVVDWLIIIAVLITIIGVGAWVSKSAAKDSASYFLGGRNMPWWLLGTSMVATTFAADTPNLVTGLVRTGGVASNWVWWCFLITGMITAFVYAKLWRRLGVTTDIEFYEHRYSGNSASFLRGFRAVYLGIFFNIMIMANVTLAAIKFGAVLFDVPPEVIVLSAGLVTVIFSTAGGLLGVLITDLILFVISMLGAVFAAYYAIGHPDVGGLANLVVHPNVSDKLSFLPDLTDPNQLVPFLIIPLAVQWWSAWYPGSEPGGGGYAAQRMLAAKDEKHAVAATVFFNFAHYAIRPWPWILVALASLIVFPDLASLEAAMPHVEKNLISDDLAYPAMLTFLPAGLLGLVVASLIAAYISTMSTSLNWGASYVVNDVYARFVKPSASEKERVLVGRLTTVLLMGAAAFVAIALDDAVQSFQLLLSIGAGTGLLFFVRWFWARVNVWSEVSAMVISFSVNSALTFIDLGLEAWVQFVVGVAVTTAGWIIVTLVTSPTNSTTLARFQKRITKENTDGPSQSVVNGKADIRNGLLASLWAIGGVYAALFGVGYLIYGTYLLGFGLLAITAIAAFVTIQNIQKL